MGKVNDPFEELKKKLQEKKRAQAAKAAGSGAARPTPSKPQPAQKPSGPTPKGSSSWLEQMTEGTKRPAAQAARPAPAKPAPSKPASGPAAGVPPPRGIIRNAWSKEDLAKMGKSREQVGEGPPSKFRSHRFDSELDETKKGGAKKDSGPVQRPKGFRADRFDRG